MDKVAYPDKRDIFRSIVYLLIYVTVFGASVFYLLPYYWYIWLALVLPGMLLLRCPKYQVRSKTRTLKRVEQAIKT